MENTAIKGQGLLIENLSLDEIDLVDGAADAKVVSAGATIMASSLYVAAVPPAAGAIATIGLAVVVMGLAFD
ncbi:hypothetical protein [Novosphingopyxis iocasae]|uniref:hypothetical protein n=1 Tax=Novosphingopyxis iocasae TaxID=2762729 RepID=UPI0016510738|nr:hypothetical protein [Novosphingopyxis iocasae]|tara:strand:+ start:228 stop:443 length:216 start_codon:yes stop_codon:yes gene_type:complete